MFSAGAAAQLSRQHVERTRPVPVRPLASLAAADDASTTPVQWRHGLVAALEHNGDRVVLRLPDRTMTFLTSCGDAMQALHRGKITDAGGLPGLDRADATVLIRRLLRGGRRRPSRRMTAARRQPCSDQSLARNDPMYGTASAGSAWMLLELSGSWGAFGVFAVAVGHRSPARTHDRSPRRGRRNAYRGDTSSRSAAGHAAMAVVHGAVRGWQ